MNVVNTMSKDIYYEVYISAHNNAILLLKSAQALFETKLYPQSYVMAYTALEEISKSQFSADIYTGFRKEEDFKSFYKDHNNKITNIGWAHNDATSSPYRYKWIGPDMDDVEEINPEKPFFQKRQSALYVDIDFQNKKISKPSEVISEQDAKEVIHIVEVALHRIWEVSNDEFGTGIIGTKGFLK